MILTARPADFLLDPLPACVQDDHVPRAQLGRLLHGRGELASDPVRLTENDFNDLK